MLAPQVGAHATQNDLGHPLLDDRILPIHRMPPPLPFQPALIFHDGFHICNLRSDDIGSTHNFLPLIRIAAPRGFRFLKRIDPRWQNQPAAMVRIPPSMKKLLLALGFAALGIGLDALLRGRVRRKRQRPASIPSYDEIAMCAYFIGLDREARGEPSAPLQDWTEAEHQLTAQTQCAAPASTTALTR